MYLYGNQAKGNPKSEKIFKKFILGNCGFFGSYSG